ncbi:MAG: fatty acid alpha-hydroxylase [Chaenotheca gracillima]|nr:MAG: fatty acid alpha-hydroxylase [Chaenotheca gracillima]
MSAATPTKPHPSLTQSFATRAALPNVHPLSRYLFLLMTAKSSNLCLAADVTTSSQLLEIAEEVGDHICVLKTHADIIYDWGENTITSLQEIAERKRFLIFEDRKFGDIGSTVQRQYTAGPLQIIRWASLTNAHVFPGPAIISALKAAARNSRRSYNQSVQTQISAEDKTGSPNDQSPSNHHPAHLSSEGSMDSIVSTTTIETHVEPSGRALSDSSDSAERAFHELGEPPLERGLLLLAQMSSQNNLLTADYTRECVNMARQHPDFVVGLIAQQCLNVLPEDNFITFTPGVSLPPRDHSASPDHPTAAVGPRKMSATDGLGQQYHTPRNVIYEMGSDIAIVGRGILGSRNRASEAKRFQDESWAAYQARIARLIS